MAELRLDQGRWDRAIAHIEKALPLVEASGAIARMVEVQTILAAAYRSAKKWTEHRQHLEKVERLCQDAQLTGLMPRIYLERAYFHAWEGEFTRAESCIREMVPSPHNPGNRPGAGQADLAPGDVPIAGLEWTVKRPLGSIAAGINWRRCRWEFLIAKLAFRLESVVDLLAKKQRPAPPGIARETPVRFP